MDTLLWGLGGIIIGLLFVVFLCVPIIFPIIFRDKRMPYKEYLKAIFGKN
jgi:hypothetical protein